MQTAINSPTIMHKITGLTLGAVALFITAIFATIPAHADQDNWLEGKIAHLQALDKITARISTLKIPVGVPTRYRSLQITIHACTFRPPTMAPEQAALVEIRTIDHHDKVAEEDIFQGWMFASSPAVNALEHPVYDVSVLACKND